VAVFCEHCDEPSGSGATNLVLLNNTLSGSDCIASNVRMINES
jgi:hypothetical protein